MLRSPIKMSDHETETRHRVGNTTVKGIRKSAACALDISPISGKNTDKLEQSASHGLSERKRSRSRSRESRRQGKHYDRHYHYDDDYRRERRRRYSASPRRASSNTSWGFIADRDRSDGYEANSRRRRERDEYVLVRGERPLPEAKPQLDYGFYEDQDRKMEEKYFSLINR